MRTEKVVVVPSDSGNACQMKSDEVLGPGTLENWVALK